MLMPEFSQELVYLLLPLFFAIALLHSSVGLAGGSSYTAIMALLGFPLAVIPSISLSLNTLVSGIAARNFIRFAHFRWRLWLPFQLSALPCVYWGAQIVLPAALFYSLLLVTLLLSMWRLSSVKTVEGISQGALRSFTPVKQWVIQGMVGAALGFLSGSMGIGGGVYLVPAILLLGLGSVRQASATAIVFIFVNSVLGLVTKWQLGLVPWAWVWLPLMAVAVGGAVGSWLGASHWRTGILVKILVGVMGLVCVLLLQRLLLSFS